MGGGGDVSSSVPVMNLLYSTMVHGRFEVSVRGLYFGRSGMHVI